MDVSTQPNRSGKWLDGFPDSLGTNSSVRTQLLVLRSTTLSLVVLVAYYLYSSYYAAGLNRYPGPFLAKFGKLWHGIDVWRNRHQLDLVDLHRKHGDVVRIGPTSLSVSNPDYVSKIYGVSTGFLKTHSPDLGANRKTKSDMYDVFVPRINGKPQPLMLSIKDNKEHAMYLKPMAKEYSVAVISEYEPLVDKTVRRWIDGMDERFCQKPREVCDVALWIRLFAIESIMDITFSESIGLLDNGGDVERFLESLDRNVDLGGRLLPMPWTAKVAIHNPIAARLKKDNTMFPEWSIKRVTARMAACAEGRMSGIKNSENEDLPDFLDRILDAFPSSEPPGYNFPLVMNWCLANIFAGGDTTAIAMTSIVYNLLKNPVKQENLVKELRTSNIALPMSWKDCQTLPYLNGCVREGIRLRPPIGMGLEREAGGLRMPDGYVLPEEVKVGMNPWVVNRQPSVFGNQVDDFVPERWLQGEDEADEDFRERINRMKRVDITFGSGSRACAGRHVAYMEMYKAIAMLFREFEINLVDPVEEWTQVNLWATRVENVRCHIRKATLK